MKKQTRFICQLEKDSASPSQKLEALVPYFTFYYPRDKFAIYHGQGQTDSNFYAWGSCFTEETKCSLDEFIAFCKSETIDIVFLATFNPEQRLLEVFSIEVMANILLRLKEAGFSLGLAGKMEAPDIARFSAFSVDYFCCHWQNLEANLPLLAQLKAKTERYKPPKIIQKHPDQLHLVDWVLPAKIGAYAFEKEKSQNILINFTGLYKEGRGRYKVQDSMESVFSYDILLDGIKILLTLRPYTLLETLAEDIAHFALAQQVFRSVKVSVSKVSLGPRAVTIEIERWDDSY